MKVISLSSFRNRNKLLEFSWSFAPVKFYPIDFSDLDRILQLLSYDNKITANIKYRCISKEVCSGL